MIVGVPKESRAGEKRVALSPDAAGALVKKGFTVQIEKGAGFSATFPDEAYIKKGAEIVEDRAKVFKADLVLQVQSPGANVDHGHEDIALLDKSSVLIGCTDPLSAHPNLKTLADKGVTHFALEMIPRITRAQSMDVLSSQANLAGYMCGLMAAMELPQVCPMFMTAAGTIKPARILVVGAGVAGLQAIATAKRLGAVVSAYDVRPACKEQVQSLGAKFVELEIEANDAEDKGGYAKEQSEEQLKRQQALMAKVVAESDAVITTAAIPGRKAPVIVTKAMVDAMRPGSVIIDLAAERGGNCEYTKANETVVVNGVRVVGPSNVPSMLAKDASLMYANNVVRFIDHITNEGALNLDFEDEITGACVVCHDGKIVLERIKDRFGEVSEDEASEASEESKGESESKEAAAVEGGAE